MKKTAREIQKEQTKALLTQAAYAVFSEKGIMLSRASDIAQAANVSHGTVFAHFLSMDALIEEVVALYGQKIALRTHELARCSAGLPTLLRAHLDGIMEYEPFYTRLVLENRLLPPGARDSLVGIQSAISFHFSQALGKDTQYGRSVAPFLLFNMWVGLVHYYIANGDLFSPEGGVVRRHGDMLIQNYLCLLQA